jgi:hypothetical protein
MKSHSSMAREGDLSTREYSYKVKKEHYGKRGSLIPVTPVSRGTLARKTEYIPPSPA